MIGSFNFLLVSENSVCQSKCRWKILRYDSFVQFPTINRSSCEPIKIQLRKMLCCDWFVQFPVNNRKLCLLIEMQFENTSLWLVRLTGDDLIEAHVNQSKYSSEKCCAVIGSLNFLLVTENSAYRNAVWKYFPVIGSFNSRSFNRSSCELIKEENEKYLEKYCAVIGVQKNLIFYTANKSRELVVSKIDQLRFNSTKATSLSLSCRYTTTTT